MRGKLNRDIFTLNWPNFDNNLYVSTYNNAIVGISLYGEKPFGDMANIYKNGGLYFVLIRYDYTPPYITYRSTLRLIPTDYCSASYMNMSTLQLGGTSGYSTLTFDVLVNQSCAAHRSFTVEGLDAIPNESTAYYMRLHTSAIFPTSGRARCYIEFISVYSDNTTFNFEEVYNTPF